MMMTNNTTTPSGNDNTTPLNTGPSPSLVVGLTLFFLLLVIVVGLIVYKYHSKMRNMVHFGQRRSQTKEVYRETSQQDDSHQYTSMITEQPTGHTPIYENLTTQTAQRKTSSMSESKFPGEPEEDVYLQCDSLDDAIYSNDPACNLSILPDTQEEEDVYIVPDSL